MSKQAFEKIASGLQDAIAYADGRADLANYRIHVPDVVDVRDLRRKLKLTQAEFARRYGFNVTRVRDWEQHRSRPDGAIRAYLRVIECEPGAVGRALQLQDVA